MSKFKLRKRVPSSLIPILNTKEINKTFHTQSQLDNFNKMFQDAIEIARSDLPKDMIKELVLTIHNKGLKPYHKEPNSTTPKTMYLEDITALYLAYSKEFTTTNEYKVRVQFFNKLLPTLFKHLNIPMEINKITSSHLYILSKKIQTLPNRRIYQYRTLSISEYVSLKVPTTEYMLPDSANKMIKRIRGLANYGNSTGLYNLVNTIPTIKVPTTDGSRVSLSANDYKILSNVLNTKAKLLLDTVYFSGLRPSEIYKSTINSIADVIVFDLTNPTCALKTKASYRFVPIHKHLLPHIDDIKALTYPNIRAQSQLISKMIKKVLSDTKGKSLYSARHSVVTNLINNDIPPERVSAIVGHSFSTTTMSIYFKGYELSQLMDDINTL